MRWEWLEPLANSTWEREWREKREVMEGWRNRLVERGKREHRDKTNRFKRIEWKDGLHFEIRPFQLPPIVRKKSWFVIPLSIIIRGYLLWETDELVIGGVSATVMLLFSSSPTDIGERWTKNDEGSTGLNLTRNDAILPSLSYALSSLILFYLPSLSFSLPLVGSTLRGACERALSIRALTNSPCL